MAYLLDANVFIEAKNRCYGFDVCAGFWDWILASHEEGAVISVENVESELVGGEDELAAWARNRGEGGELALQVRLAAASAQPHRRRRTRRRDGQRDRTGSPPSVPAQAPSRHGDPPATRPTQRAAWRPSRSSACAAGGAR
jgi:hypothetical protein